MTALEEQLRAELQSLGLHRIPAGRDPDVYVFGDWYPAGRVSGFPFPACQVHQVGWHGLDPCWCCEAGVKPLITETEVT